jgi:predicted outer membrane protein
MQRLYMMGVVDVKTLVGGSATAEKRPRTFFSVFTSPDQKHVMSSATTAARTEIEARSFTVVESKGLRSFLRLHHF